MSRHESVVASSSIAVVCTVAILAGLNAFPPSLDDAGLKARIVGIPVAHGQQGDDPSRCVPELSKLAGPSVVALGSTVDVTLTGQISCPPETLPLHVVLVMDASGGTSGAADQAIKDVARGLVTHLELADNPGTRVGIVEYASTATTTCGLSDQEGQIIGCINSVTPGGDSRLDLGLEAALAELRRGRSIPTGWQFPREIVVVLSGTASTECAPVLDSARALKSQGVLVVVICTAAGCKQGCSQSVATSPRYYFEGNDTTAGQDVLDRVRVELSLRIRRVTVTDTLPANMTYQHHIHGPQPEWDPDARRLKWSESLINAFTYTVRILPSELGAWPTNVEARAVFTDTFGLAGAFTFTVPMVTVVEPGALATPTATRSPTATATTSPETRNWSIYAPIVSQRRER